MKINSNHYPQSFDQMEYKPLRAMHKEYIAILKQALKGGHFINFSNYWTSFLEDTMAPLIATVRAKYPSYKRNKPLNERVVHSVCFNKMP